MYPWNYHRCIHNSIQPLHRCLSLKEKPDLKPIPSVETLFSTVREMYFLILFCLLLYIFFLRSFLGVFFSVKEDWDYFVTSQILKQQDFKRLNQQNWDEVTYFKVKLPGASHVLLSLLRVCPTTHEQLNDPGEFVQICWQPEVASVHSSISLLKRKQKFRNTSINI